MRKPSKPALQATGIAGVTAISGAMPYIVASRVTPKNDYFVGSLSNIGDTGQYLSAIRQGAEGHFLYLDQYTSQPLERIFLYPVYTLTGFVTRPFHLTALTTYHALHIVCVVALFYCLWMFCRSFAPGSAVLTYLIAVVGTGLYPIAAVIIMLASLSADANILTAPEFSVYGTALISPHESLGLAAFLACLLACRRCLSGVGTISSYVVLAVSTCVLCLTYPFALTTLFVVLTTTGLLTHYREGLSTRLIVGMAIAVSPGVCCVAYYGWLFKLNSTWRASGMSHLPALSILVVLIAFAPLGLLAMSQLKRSIADPNTRLVGVWALAVPMLLLLPIPQSERLTGGWSTALAILGSFTMVQLSRVTVRRLCIFFIVLTLFTPVFLISAIQKHAAPGLYLPSEERTLAQWMGAHCTARDVVMAAIQPSYDIVAFGSCRVVLGQRFETFSVQNAASDVAIFYNSLTIRPVRLGLLKKYHVTYVVTGPDESTLGSFVPSGAGYQGVYHVGSESVFRLRL